MSPPLINLNSQSLAFRQYSDGPFSQKFAEIGSQIGAKQLGYNLTVVQPGCKACPMHNHRGEEEMFLILAGTGTLRFGKNSYSIKEMDIIACPTGDSSVAHQIINTGTAELRYLALGTRKQIDIIEYPDSNKIMCTAYKDGDCKGITHMSNLSHSLNYLDGES